MQNQHNMSEEPSILKSHFTANFDGAVVTCTTMLSCDWCLWMTLETETRPYPFTFTRGQEEFELAMRLYIQETGDAEFGTLDPDTQAVRATRQQRTLFSHVMPVHVMECLDAVLASNRGSAIDYASWYVRQGRQEKDYSTLIQSLACAHMLKYEMHSHTVSRAPTVWRAKKLT